MLKFSPRNYLGEEDFMVAVCNETAYRAVKIWPYWQHFSLCVYGPRSCGKSHLAHIWVDRIQKSLPRPIPIPILPAHRVNMKNINKLANENDFWLLKIWMPKLTKKHSFTFIISIMSPGKYVLFTAEQPLAKLPLRLPDLKSRLNIVPCIEIMQPDDEMLTALIAKLFNDRQIIISQEILDYILKHTERSFEFVSRLIAEIDDISWTNGRAVSVPIIREALKNLTRNQQMELFI